MMGKIFFSVALCLAVAFTGFVHTHIDPTTRADQGEAYLPRPDSARAAAFGFQSVLADFYWLQAVQTVGGYAIVDETKARQIGKLIDVVTTLNPWVDHPYRFASIWMTEGEDNVRMAVDLMRRGVEYHPDEWRNWFYMGFSLFYYLGENAEAAEALEIASGLPGSPAYLPRLVARLHSKTADIDVSAMFLHQLIAGTEDESRKAGYRAALDEIEIEQKARFLDRARAAYKKLAGEDITRVEDLVLGQVSVVQGLPRPYPDALPPTAGGEARWIIGDDDRIISTFYGARYELYLSHGNGVDGHEMDEGEDAAGAARESTSAAGEGGDIRDHDEEDEGEAAGSGGAATLDSEGAGHV